MSQQNLQENSENLSVSEDQKMNENQQQNTVASRMLQKKLQTIERKIMALRVEESNLKNGFERKKKTEEKEPAKIEIEYKLYKRMAKDHEMMNHKREQARIYAKNRYYENKESEYILNNAS
jgi:hypothetical protein